jgi:hypothetical protein
MKGIVRRDVFEDDGDTLSMVSGLASIQRASCIYAVIFLYR